MFPSLDDDFKARSALQSSEPLPSLLRNVGEILDLSVSGDLALNVGYHQESPLWSIGHLQTLHHVALDNLD